MQAVMYVHCAVLCKCTYMRYCSAIPCECVLVVIVTVHRICIVVCVFACEYSCLVDECVCTLCVSENLCCCMHGGERWRVCRVGWVF